MPLTIQGNWTVRLISFPIDLPQRFIISGATVGNGTYPDTYTVPINVQGQSWRIEVQEFEDGLWRPSINFRTTDVITQNGFQTFKAEFDDRRGGVNFDDLVLLLSRVVSIDPQPDPVLPPAPEPPVPPVIPTDPYIPPPRVDPPVVLVPGKVFTKFKVDEKLPREQKIETFGIWLDYTGSATGNMTSFFTCSLDTGSYKKSVYNAQCYTCSSKPHFDIAYGHDGGSGSRDLGGNDFYTPSNAVYGQYRGLCLDNGQRRFKIGNNEIFHFYAINVATERMGDSLDEGNLELNLHALSGSEFLLGNGNRNAHTGSNVRLGTSGKILRLIDDSTLDFSGLSQNALNGVYSDVSESMCHLSTSAGKVFYMVSGSLETGIYSSSQPHVYGISYPQLGIVLLDAEKLDMSASFLTVTGSDVAGDNAMKLFTAMSGSARFTDESGDYLGFQARKVRYSYMEQFFVRVLNQDYNFTNNLTYQTGSEGDIISDFYNKPQVYITEIGLFNDQNEMLAIAKLSAPVLKSFTEEALFEINLCW